jgi:hypothetical protein
MALPCNIKCNNGYELNFIPRNDNFKANLLISILNSDMKKFIFDYDKLYIFYIALLNNYKSINSQTCIARTINFPNIRLNEYMATIIHDGENNCLITLNTKLITSKEDNYKKEFILELNLDNLHKFILIMEKTLYEDLEN